MQDFTDQQIDHYHVLEPLGQGGMAVVYKAYDTQLERDVAIKFIRIEGVTQERDERLILRFQREARAMAKLVHPNIVQVMDYGEFEGTPYLVMPYLSGGTLKSLTGSPMPYRQAASLLAPIADALAFAHSQGIIHRDIKPANILITESGTPMLSDFGIAKLLEEQDVTLTSTGFGVGTPHYMAPEQVENKVVPQTDIYALGTIFYELVTGKKPYDAETPAAILVKRATEPLVRPRTFISNLPEDVEKVIFKAMTYRPENRYETMAKFNNVLDALASGQSVPVPETPDWDTHNSASSKTPEEAEGTTRDLFEPSPPPIANVPGKPTSEKKRSIPKWAYWIGAGGILATIVCIVMVVALRGVLSGRETEPVQSAISNSAVSSTDTPTTSSLVTDIETPDIVLTATVAFTPTASLGIGSTTINDVDRAELVYIPAGGFIMGSNDSGVEADEMPAHEVYLDAYWIYKNEVTQSQFRECLESGGCSDNHYFVESDNYPMIYVSWYEAEEYCNWAGGRLPTEAEWEKAARGSDGWTYPWGNDYPTSGLANFYIDVVGSTTPVGSFPSGASPYGALDMAGNVMEWVSDWYDSNYYYSSPVANPTGPSSGSTHVFRGSSYYASALKLRVTIRHNRNPSDTYDNVGFRCVFDDD